MYYVYILLLADKTYYIGFSSELRKRVAAHMTGDVPQTGKYRPLRLIFYSAFTTKTKALEFEKYLKTGSGFSFRNKHFI